MSLQLYLEVFILHPIANTHCSCQRGFHSQVLLYILWSDTAQDFKMIYFL